MRLVDGISGHALDDGVLTLRAFERFYLDAGTSRRDAHGFNLAKHLGQRVLSWAANRDVGGAFGLINLKHAGDAELALNITREHVSVRYPTHCLRSMRPPAIAVALIEAFAERHEGAVPVFARGPDTLTRASPFGERYPANCAILGGTGIGHHDMVADLSVFVVEMYTLGEIVEARKSFDAASATDALVIAKAWLIGSEHNATNFRVVDLAGTILIDRLMTNL